MDSRMRKRTTTGKYDESERASALDENVQAMKRWESTILLARSKAEQVSDWIACTAGTGSVLQSERVCQAYDPRTFRGHARWRAVTES